MVDSETPGLSGGELCPWCGKKPQAFRVHPESEYADPCGVPRVRCITYQCPLNCIEFKPSEWNTRATPTPVDDDRVREIAERRARITEPPWFYHAPTYSVTSQAGVLVELPTRVQPLKVDQEKMVKGDYEFIANAPSDIDYLLDRLAQVEAQLKGQQK